jgi:Fur family ferric uptake transcriptional regulator
VPTRRNASPSDAAEQLRASGNRVTSARLAIIEALSATDAHLCADDVVRAVHERAPGVHRATVYRTLDSLVAAGLVAHTHLGHGSAVYHRTTLPHAHCECQRCGAVIDVPNEVLRSATRRLRDDFGFTLDAGHSTLLGLCDGCASAVRPRAGGQSAPTDRRLTGRGRSAAGD